MLWFALHRGYYLIRQNGGPRSVPSTRLNTGKSEKQRDGRERETTAYWRGQAPWNKVDQGSRPGFAIYELCDL